MKKPTLVLASSSSARRSIMDKLGVPYKTATPDIDETLLPNESAIDLVKRLSLEKALAVSPQFSDALIIGCDLVVTLDHHILGKPLNASQAYKQLKLQSGREITVYSGICLLNTRTQQSHIAVDEIKVKFRKLSDDDIHNYIRRDQPLHCAGSIKCESVGMILLEWIHCNDFNALIGLPLVTLNRLLSYENVNLLEITAGH